MILEYFFTSRRVEKKPYLAFFLAFSYALLSIIFSLLLPWNISLVSLFMVTIACLPSLNRLLALEERKGILEIEKKELLNILKMEDPKKFEEIKEKLWKKVRYPLIMEFKNVIGVFFFFFLGLFSAYFLLGLLLPSQGYSSLFAAQIEEIQRISKLITGGVVYGDALGLILSNNLRVAFFVFLFSLIYGIGSMFILVWNSSILACGVSNFIRNEISQLALSGGATHIFSYFHVIPLAFGAYMIHGTIEIFSYFIMAVAGALLSIGITKRGVRSKEFVEFAINIMDLVLISIILLIIAAIVEVTLPSLLRG
ncbi:MAG: stage II sporulation protein M [Candidatus Nanoarchaeia archaeon]|nr:stage II sporulation protein M [Candidatus Haiyanarchaeum thermophilum]MCW1303407.1 stage II sporulation protein M [Candidatus Haiyanarchaeum thermophilum]MCW1303906.1 stage II sporulation protein M [Candidatus Haiyanarchaeum thermophilum]MCW1306769.1 stage II sporulation protein M [Candidatus Haiyanarchaeum thermophilum]MCW1307433.1 stage II sporulation protein M [Candidatus Haiyanarchaeum thermophilum]